MVSFLGVFLGGGIGSLLRFWVCSRICSHWGVMLVNVIGALVIGIAYQYFSLREAWRPEIRAFVITGLLGGFTTFSTYMLDFGNLITAQKNGEAVLYLLGSLSAGILFLAAGIVLGRMIFE